MRNLFLQFWPKIKKSNSSKIIEISALVKIYSTKLNFLSQFCCCYHRAAVQEELKMEDKIVVLSHSCINMLLYVQDSNLI